MDKLFSLGEVAKLLQVAPYRIQYAISVHKLPEPTYRFLAKRCFNSTDLQRIAVHFGVKDVPVPDDAEREAS